ncbi:malate:quinone oxidoreductase [Sporosarcina sp. P3]|uniref:malate:quinone oxidoreductase n=1 Tax=Sporosarcina TaxID=1569 RepID=UPI0009DC7C61|nr:MULTISPECIES: malate:quinone oxidoreductase [Sporosarcina]ARF17461.1 malate:quinone oxidoreductase [Sporosarcina ureae]PID22386.1 malate:quinone oxidoreductase [Sporosarcina sp. P3]
MSNRQTKSDVILIGAGIMSATLGTMLKELAPDWNISLFEKLDKAGEESSHEMNNAGTGHAALCELNYTSERPDGTVDIAKAVKVNEQFQLSMQFWAHLVEKKLIENPEQFIMPLPHMSLVQGEDNVEYLKKRFEAMTANPLFQGMEFSEDPEKLKEWIPLIMKDRTVDEAIAATKIDTGTDVNFGALTRMLIEHMQKVGVDVNYGHQVEDIKRTSDGEWELRIKNNKDGKLEFHKTKFVFIGGGGGSLPLLQKTGIPESKHIGGFPISGVFMVCKNPEVIAKHHAKVYGKAKVGAPPMSVPHLDTRYIDGEKSLLFGPFAGFTPKFLKEGSMMDLIGSVKPNNLTTMLACGAKNLSLTKYLVEQVVQTKEQRINELREFIPDAKSEDWDLWTAGQRVQVIKDTPDSKGTLQFGTELVTDQDGSIAALLGASPGASTAVAVMLDLINKCFPGQVSDWEPKLKEMIPSYGKALAEHPELLKDMHASTSKILKLTENELEKETVHN